MERFGATFAPSGKVVQVENDAERDVFNDDSGSAERRGQVAVQREMRSRGILLTPPSLDGDLDLGWGAEHLSTPPHVGGHKPCPLSWLVVQMNEARNAARHEQVGQHVDDVHRAKLTRARVARHSHTDGHHGTASSVLQQIVELGL